MAYNKTTWIDDVTPLDAEHLNNMEDGIEKMHKATINGKLLSSNPSLTAADVGALPASTKIPIVDKKFSSTSENAQSGKAVAEAVTIEQNRANNTFAPAIKNTVSGSVLAVHDVSPVEHDLNIKLSSDTLTDFSAVSVIRCGKNLMPYPYLDTTKIQNGLTFIDNGDGSITIDGTATALTYFNLASQPLTLPAGTYMLSGNNGEANIGNQIFLQKTGLYINDNGVGKTFTLTEETTFGSIGLFIGGGNTMDNITFKPQLELGSTATDYEPYIVPQIATTNADGTVDGLTSLSPNMTIMSDTEGVAIYMTYNADTKMYIDNKLAEISTAIVNNV